MENNYIVQVSSDIREITVSTTKGQAMQTITGTGDYILGYGENDIIISVTSESGLVNNYKVTVNREFDFGLENLIVSHNDTIYNLSPEYSDGVYEYNVNVPNEIDSVVVDATLKETLNSIEGLGEYSLVTGNNDIVLTVSYLDKGSIEYVIHVNRDKCSDNKLSSLQVAEGVIDPIFDPETLEYNVNIPFEYDSATVLYETSSDSAMVEVIGNTDLEIEVTKDGKEKDKYSI